MLFCMPAAQQLSSKIVFNLALAWYVFLFLITTRNYRSMQFFSQSLSLLLCLSICLWCDIYAGESYQANYFHFVNELVQNSSWPFSNAPTTDVQISNGLHWKTENYKSTYLKWCCLLRSACSFYSMNFNWCWFQKRMNKRTNGRTTE